MKRCLTIALALTVALVGALVLAQGGVSSGGTADAAGSSRIDVIIGFKAQPGPAEQALVQRAGGTIKYAYHLVPAIAASVPEAAIAGLQANPNVTNIDLDIEIHAIDAELDNTWGVEHIGAGAVHVDGYKGNGVKVGVLDSGIDTDHPDLNLNYDPSCSYNFVDGDENVEDGYGHGTHTAGTVAALDNGYGVVGVAPEATLCIYKVLSNSGSGSYSAVIAALERAVTDGVQVTNNSYGSSGDPGPTVKAAFDKAYAAGVLHVAAAGNSGNRKGKGNNCIYPARWDSLIATAATKQDDNRATFSSTCPEMELAAPGYRINSTVPGDGYGTKSGTSMASPHVAGVAALVIAAGITDVDEVRQRLADTADDLGPAGRDTMYGFGLVRPDQAVAGLTPSSTGSIAGTVTNAADSTAISGASVVVEGTSLSATTDANGDYTIADVPTGDHTATASTDGFDSASQTVAVAENATAAAAFALSPTPVGSIAGKVTNGADSTAISGASVVVEGTSLSATTDANGDYTIADVSTGDHTVTASADGFESASQTVTVAENATATANFALAETTTASTAKVDSITYVAEGGKNKDKHLLITVTVLDDLNDPVGGASVSIDLSRDGSVIASGTGTTATDGTLTFSLKNASVGCYTTKVMNVDAAGLEWDGGTPDNVYDKGDESC